MVVTVFTIPEESLLIKIVKLCTFAEVSRMSSRLTSESRIYADKARDLNRQVSMILLLRWNIMCYS